MALGFSVIIDVAASWPSPKVVVAATMRGAMVVVVRSCPTGHCMADVAAVITTVVLH
ncbi:hypothetical protein D8674_040305 [Pyrus ussuriensis x Pyrus communis]|uniref:Uncharacterized protein n=1 Tax=Pyrus ussuriensis x Pyrus communis TaxID=2448454 RepID=A0A5N5FQ36_9ROSA|nr:hypothetical protein D8674_040305 [Pyrus ussuriensis x Pyrus communis]